MRASLRPAGHPRKKHPRMRGGGVEEKATTLNCVINLFNDILGDTNSIQYAEDSKLTYTPTGDPRSTAYLTTMAQLEMYLKMKLGSLGCEVYDGSIFMKYRDAEEKSEFGCYVNTTLPMIHRSLASSAPSAPSAPLSTLRSGGSDINWSIMDNETNIQKSLTKATCQTIRQKEAGKTVYSLEGITEGSMCFSNASASSSRQTERTQLQRLADTTTSIIVNRMFKNDDDLNNYLITFIQCVNARLDEYFKVHTELVNSACLVYKGGNVLVDYFNQMNIAINDLTATASILPLLKRSDTDFQFFFKTTDLFVRHNDAIKRLLVAALYDFQSKLTTLTTVNGAADNFLLPRKVQFTADELKDFNTILSPNTLRSLLIEPRTDTFILNAKNDIPPYRDADPASNLIRKVIPKWVAQTKIKDECTFVVVPCQPIVTVKDHSRVAGTYITFNDTLRFGQDPIYASFDLIRLKLNINLTIKDEPSCVYHVPSELIDISISNPDDYKVRSITGEGLDTWTQTIELDIAGLGRTDPNEPDDESIRCPIRIPTLEYLMDSDLYSILFVESNGFPWMDQKYSKRLFRYIMGNVLLVFQQLTKVLGDAGPATKLEPIPIDIFQQYGRPVVNTLLAQLKLHLQDITSKHTTTPNVPLDTSFAEKPIIFVMGKILTQTGLNIPNAKLKDAAESAMARFNNHLLQPFVNVVKATNVAIQNKSMNDPTECIKMLTSIMEQCDIITKYIDAVLKSPTP